MRLILVLSFAFLLAAPSRALAQEHPEHSSGGHEHPAEHSMEHPAPKPRKANKPKAAPAPKIEDVARAITDYVAKEARLKGGWFTVYDAEAQAPLALKLTKVHRERLSKVYPGVWFVCADFTTPQGKVYDLDFFMKGSSPATLEVTEVTVHKEAGKARYGWAESGGVWRKTK